MRWIALLALALAGLAQGQEIRLQPVSIESVGQWAQALVPLRLKPTPAQDVKLEGTTLALSQWGEVALGQARYTLLLGALATGEVQLWVDRNRDRKLTADEALRGQPVSGGLTWSLNLQAEPAGGEPYAYPVVVLWPEGRGYVFLLGGAPRRGALELEGGVHTFTLVDGDLDGVYGSKGDFYVVDVDGDEVLYGDPDGHERFAFDEAFTVGNKSFRLSRVAPDGRWVQLAPTVFVPPKVALIPGHAAPDFQFRSFATGQTLALSHFRGRVVLLDFWATWCGPCMNELPSLLTLYKKFSADGFEIVGVSLDIHASELQRVIESYGIPWPVAFEGKQWDNSLAQLYRVYQIPTSYLLDRQGRIRYRDLHGEELAARVAELLAEGQPVAPAEPSPPAVVLPTTPQPILEIKVPAQVGVVSGQKSTLQVVLVNTEAYEAEEVRVFVQNLPSNLKAAEVEVGSIPPFGERTVTLALEAGDLTAELSPSQLHVVYHYCIDDSCFQMVQKAELRWALGAAPSASSGLWSPVWIVVLLVVGLVAAWFIRGRLLSVVLVLLVVVGAVTLALGVMRGQSRQAQRVGSTLCTSCVGLEATPSRKVSLSPTAQAVLATVNKPVRITVFYTVWCKSCPYVKDLVQEMAKFNSLIQFEFVDAEVETARAEAAGVWRSGRLVVPATVVAGSSEVLFGAQGIEARLLEEIRKVTR